MKDDVRAVPRKGVTLNHRFPIKEIMAALATALALLGCGSLSTITPTAVPPAATVTPIPPTRTATSTPTPTATSTPGVIVTPVCAQCTITVISAKNEGARVLYDTTGGGTYITVKDPNTHFLAVQVQIEGMGDADVEGIGWFQILLINGKMVRDRNGNTYDCTYSWSDRPKTERSREITYYFEVPDNIVITDLVWLDRPPIPLEVK